MAKIAVIHRELGVGGGEAVCFHILEALQTEHDVHLYALNYPDLDTLNEAFGTAVQNITIHTPPLLTQTLRTIDAVAHRTTKHSFGVNAGLELAALSRRYVREWAEYDLRISTHGELPLPAPSIQYIHHPILNRWSGGGHFQVDRPTGRLLNCVFTLLSGARRDNVAQSTVLTNSQWTADQLRTLYDSVDVVYPPIDTSKFSQVPWSDRADGFTMIGRVSQDKRSHRAITILEGVRELGHDVHVHIIGPIPETAYGRRVRAEATRRDWVTLEGRVSRDRLVELIQQHRWGIHTKPYEHFGMAVAEQVAGGTVPFVPDNGGQVEIVGDEPRLLYTSTNDAVKKIDKLLSDRGSLDPIRDFLQVHQQYFKKERFHREIKRRVTLI